VVNFLPQPLYFPEGTSLPIEKEADCAPGLMQTGLEKKNSFTPDGIPTPHFQVVVIPTAVSRIAAGLAMRLINSNQSKLFK
jgi:hypothetical protein